MKSIDSPVLPVAEAYHGGIDLKELARFGIRAEDAIDFSSNILPHGPSPLVHFAIAKAQLDRYPDRECHNLRDTIGNRHGIDPNRILVGNGCSELIHLVACSLLNPQDEVLVIGPTFSEYRRASRLASATVIECLAEVDSGFRIPVDNTDKLLEVHQFKMAWICNPNNPTGQLITAAQLIRWIDQYPQVLFVVDESYIEFCESATSLLSVVRDNLIVLRSLTKDYALAGVRLGFATLPIALYEKSIRRRVPWNVNVLAQVAGAAAIQDRAYYDAAVREVRDSKSKLIGELIKHGFHPLPSATGYFLLGIENAPMIRKQLISHGLVVRDCTSFGIENHLRIAVRDRESNDRLLASLLNPGEHVKPAMIPSSRPITPPTDSRFLGQLNELFRQRRDVRRFRRDPIPAECVKRWIESAGLAPSVGLSQPWRFVSVRSLEMRAAVISEFELQNQLAAETYKDALVSQKYRELKLAGLREAPEQLAVFVEPNPTQGRGLGRATMPESVTYSVVAAIQNFWLAARAEGVGVGWVSILRPEVIAEKLQVPETWQMVAYLCLGWPQVEVDEVPELQQESWEHRVDSQTNWFER